MFESQIELLLNHHPLFFVYRRPTDIDRLDDLERRKPLPDIAVPAEDDARTRSILDMVDIAAAILLLAGFIALMAVSDGVPPPAAVAHLPPNER
jgi:hypothetical protein